MKVRRGAALSSCNGPFFFFLFFFFPVSQGHGAVQLDLTVAMTALVNYAHSTGVALFFFFFFPSFLGRGEIRRFDLRYLEEFRGRVWGKFGTPVPREGVMARPPPFFPLPAPRRKQHVSGKGAVNQRSLFSFSLSSPPLRGG